MGEVAEDAGSIEFTWEPLEHTLANRHVSRPTRLWPAMALAFVAALAASEGAWAAGACAAFFAVLPTLVVPRFARRARALRPDLQAPVRWSWGIGSLTVVTATQESTLHPGSLSRVQRSGGLLLLWSSPTSASVIPERAFPSPAVAESMVRCAESLRAGGQGGLQRGR